MTDKEKAFFVNCLKNPLMTPELLHIAVPKYSIKDYQLLQQNNYDEFTNLQRFKWNAIRYLIQFAMDRLGYEFSELMSCISINRYLMFEYLINRKRRDDWTRTRKRGITKGGFKKLSIKKTVGRKTRKRT